MNIPDHQTLIDTALSQLKKGLSDNNIPARSTDDLFAFAVATAARGNYLYLKDYLLKQFNPLTATDEFLKSWLQTYGLTIKLATAAKGEVKFTGTAGINIPADTKIEINSIQYSTDEITTIDVNGTIEISITCNEVGAKTNLPSATKLNLVNAIVGVNQQCEVSEGGLNLGADEERINDAKLRLKQAIVNSPLGGAPSDYERWALEIAGISRAWGVRTPNGGGTAGVIIMTSALDNNYQLANSAQKQAVYDYISDPSRGSVAELFVIIPTPVYVDLKLSITPDNADTRAAVKLSLQDLFWRSAEPNKDIPFTHLSEAVSVAAGEITHSFIAPNLTAGGALTAGGVYNLLMLNKVEFV